MTHRCPSRRKVRLLAAAGAAVIGQSGCETGLDAIDRQVAALLLETSTDMGADVLPRVPGYLEGDPARLDAAAAPYEKHIPTVNPAAKDLAFERQTEAEDVIKRLESYNVDDPDAIVLDLPGTLAYAMRNSREYRIAEEEYVLAGLRLLIERHRWGPRFFNDTTVQISGSGDDGLFDTSLDLVNEFRVTQRLPYGGEVSARALARATEDLHYRVQGEGVQDAEIILDANIPLLRGAGLVAQEDLIQAERGMIYSARSFERFRREFLLETAQSFLNLVVQQQSIENSELELQSLRENETRMTTLVRVGRERPYNAALASQSALRAETRLNRQRETYRFAVDRFKVSLGMSADQTLVIQESMLDLPLPKADMDDAVRAGLTLRLDLQNLRDQVADSERRLDNAIDDLQADFDLRGSVGLPTDPDKDRAGLQFDPGELDFSAAVTFGLPLDREIERATVRRRQIELEQARRGYEEFRDRVTVDIRASIRDVDVARFNLDLEEENIRVARLRQATIDAAPERADARDRTEAAQEFANALNGRDVAARDLQVAILQYFLQTGQLRVNADGSIRRLPGMDQ
jgi:hypothetical protein